MLVILERDDNLRFREVALAQLLPLRRRVAHLHVPRRKMLVGVRREVKPRGHEMDGQPAGECPPGQSARFRVMIENRFREAAPIIIACADE